jgi:steroid Delta-isomerase
MNVDALIRYFHDLTPESVARLAEFYTEDAFFKDPFNDVRGVKAIQRIFEHMFEHVIEPRFVVTEKLANETGAVLVWQFHFGVRGWLRGQGQTIIGVSHLRFAEDGRIAYHRDYWDAAEEMYMKLPIIGTLMRILRRALSAQVGTWYG